MMSTSRGSGGNNGNGVQAPIPAGSRKMVQSLKEIIVNCPDAEIYAALKDCNMDPNEAINRLLSQDPFHEVKSKREKKKEVKDTAEFRPRGANNSSSRGSKSGADRYLSRGGSTLYNSSESATSYGKSTYKKENGSTPYTSSLSSAPALSGIRSRGLSDRASAENKGSLGTADGMPSVAQPPSVNHSAWVGVPGQVSMADIVKRGRPHTKASNASMASYNDVHTAQHSIRSPNDHDSGVSSVQQVPVIDEWPSIEKPAAENLISVPEYTVESQVHPNASVVPFDSEHQGSEAEEDQETEDDDNEDSVANEVESPSFSSKKILDEDSRDAPLFQNDPYQGMSSFQPQAHDFQHLEAEDVGASVASVARNLEQLSVRNDDRGLASDGDAPSVIIPDHLQVQTADCSHLSFGSFGSGMGAAYSSGAITSEPAQTTFEEPDSNVDVSTVLHPGAGNSEYYGDDSLRNASDGSLFHGSGANARGYDASPASRPEDLKPNNAEVAHGNQYSFPSSNPGYSYDDSQHLNAALSQTSSEMLNLASFSNIMQSYPNSLPNTLLAANVQSSRESELQYSQFPVSQSMSAKYGNSSSIGGSAISMSEALNSAGFSSTQPAPQTHSGTSIATGPPLPQHLAVHPYSQPTLPLGPFANMISYPFLPQNYTYMPPAFQQGFNNTYHQSLAAVLPQYKNNVSLNSLPQSAAIASGYGALGNTTAIPGNLSMNPAAAPSGSTLTYEDLLNSQYKDTSHLISLQQNENQAMWLHGPNSRSISSVPPSTYYNFQGQNQQPGGFRQGQQPSQNYGALGYPNIYHSQTGSMSLDQPQNPRDGSLGGSQVQPKPSQMWQNGY